MSDLEHLRKAITALESQRATLGDAVVDAALVPLRARLAELEAQEREDQPQKKYVTILFTDVVGSTRLEKNLDPEDILFFMDEAMRRFENVIQQYGGRVLRFMGDGLKAVFGHPLVREIDAENAVRAGLDLLEVSRSYAEEIKSRWGVSDFAIRVGIHTGQVILGGGIEAENTAIGATINLAARMESNAPPDSVHISHETYQHIRGLFDVQVQPPIMINGYDEPMQTYLVLRARPRAFQTMTRGIQGVATRMVGREVELAQLQNIFGEASQKKHTQIVTIVGEPGVGKSRLLDELTDWIDIQPGMVTFFKGRAMQLMANNPYSLVKDMFAGCYEILDNDPAPVARQKLEAALGQYFQNESQMKTHFIGTLLGFDLTGSPHLTGVQYDSKQLRDQALFYLTQFFEAVAHQNLVAVFLDDIQWADLPSLELITRLVSDCPDSRLLIICLARPVFFETFSEWVQKLNENGSGYTQIELNPLSIEASLQLIEEIFQESGEIPQQVTDLLVQTAEGNPFYLEELVKMLIDDGVILVDSRSGTLHCNLTRLSNSRVPPTLTAVLQARLDSLPAEEKTTLQQASVVGRIFWDSLLQYLNKSGHALETELTALTQRDMIYLRYGSAFTGTKEYIFKHAMLRDVTYATLLKNERKAYHARVAEWLENANRSGGRAIEYASMIAEHYALAGNESRAADWFIQAGERAMAQDAHWEARQFFDRALEILPATDQERRWRALLGRDEVHQILGDTDARREDDTALVAMALQMHDDDRLAAAYYRRAYHLDVTGKIQMALQIYDKALEAARRAGNRKFEAMVNGLEVVIYARLGMSTEAAIAAKAALQSAQGLEDDIALARVLTNVAIYYLECGDIARAAQLTEQQVAINHRIGNRNGESIGLGNLGYYYLQMGLYETGSAFLEQSLQLSQAIGARRMSAYTRLNLGLALLRRGNLEGARRSLELSFPELRTVKDIFGQASGHFYLALLLEKSGDISGMLEACIEARRLFEQIGALGYANDVLAGMARGFLAQGDIDQALQYVMQVWEILEKHAAQGMEFPIIAYKTCADVYEASGDAERAASAIEAGARTLIERANKISDLEWRRSYLENVPEHAWLVKAWEQRSGVSIL